MTTNWRDTASAAAVYLLKAAMSPDDFTALIYIRDAGDKLLSVLKELEKEHKEKEPLHNVC